MYMYTYANFLHVYDIHILNIMEKERKQFNYFILSSRAININSRIIILVRLHARCEWANLTQQVQ